MRIHAVGVAVAGLLGLAVPAAAEVTRFELTGPPQPVLDGREFGAASSVAGRGPRLKSDRRNVVLGVFLRVHVHSRSPYVQISVID